MNFKIVHTCKVCSRHDLFMETSDRKMAQVAFDQYIEILHDTPRTEWKRCCGHLMRLHLIEVIETY